MRKADKEQAEEIIKLLGQVHDGVKKMLEAGQKETVFDLLGQCQDAAIQLGESIERSEGEGFVTVTLLEAYCEQVYQIYESVRQGQQVLGAKVWKSLHRSLIPVKNSLNHDINVRTEAVFLPYKASMWDSLESVWRAADEDPDCDAYVIPIPYYDRNPDGSFKEEHYEGDLYPEYVPVTWYEDYDFQGRRPDLIFIHNPYDDCNYLTSVHPFFYSKNLKQFTDQLIYIPYFILGDIDPENQEAVDGMAHFCTTPGVLYADKTIVQSENMRQAYIKVLTEFTKETSATRAYWEEKILGLGSPKIDKVLNTRKEDVEVPKEWLRIIEKEDGSWKKIIFYNTGVTAILQNGEKMIAKIRDVFRVFKEHQEEVALLWRPHPLIQTTFQTMRPQLWGAYKEILDQYLEEGWGIYDDTPDLDRAIALCDGYYGDASSVVELCREKGKLVMVQDVEQCYVGKSEMIDIPAWMADFYVDDEVIWFVHGRINILMNYNIKKNCINIIGELPDENLILPKTFCAIEKFSDKLFMIPASSRYVHVYNILKNRFIKIKLKDIDKYVNLPLFSGAYAVGCYLYCIPCYYSIFIRINMKNNVIDYLLDWTKGYDVNSKSINSSKKLDEFRIIGLYLDDNKFFIYNIKENTLIVEELKERDVKIITVAQHENRIYFNYCNKIAVYSLEKKKILEKTIEIPFSMASIHCTKNGNIIIDSLNDEQVLCIDKNNRVIYHCNDISGKKFGALEYGYGNEILYKYDEKLEYIFNCHLYKMLLIDESKNETELIFSFTNEQKTKLKEIIINEMEKMMLENDFYNLYYLITTLKKDDDCNNSTCSIIRIRENIWEKI